VTYSQEVTPPPPCYVAKREKRVKGKSSLLSLESGPSLRGHGASGAVALGLALKLSRRCFPESPPKLGEELRLNSRKLIY
ncbi:uncharacterized protein NEPG_02174, partial [Nematocida parisii ERTm1]|uniref:uncharacterized protein n=1 Tax=Nematocida parisii (strain ERTm1 / ATCC PRA-289) TaxID=881290 RepID=UPI000264B69D